MTSGAPSKADSELAREATQVANLEIAPRKIEITARQIERWRQEGFLPSPVRHGRGRGMGSFAVYPRGAAEHAAALALALEREGSLHRAAVVVFLRGFTFRENILKRAYNRIFTDMRAYLGFVKDAKPRDVADRFARTMASNASKSATARQWRENLGALAKADHLDLAAGDILNFFLAGAEDDEILLPDVLEATGSASVVEHLDLEDRTRFDDFTRRLNLPALERAVEEASIEDLECARARLRSILQMLTGLPQVPPPNDFTQAVLGIPASLILGPLAGAGLALGMQMLPQDQTE